MNWFTGLNFVKTRRGAWPCSNFPVRLANVLSLFGRLENVPLVVLNFVSLKKTKVLLAKGYFGVVLL